ncbi:MAG: 3D domain-containing protein [Verrucomicrobiales bacterium]|nr:3D domain-containing protein [Verrucomicrobiales bacterium]
MRSSFNLVSVLSLSSLFASCTTTEKTAATTSVGKSKWVSTKSAHSSKSKRRTVRTTAYSHEENEPGAYGRKNAIGTTLRYGAVRSAAADWSRYPLGTQFRIVGQPHLYEIDDYGSALGGTGTIDLYKPNLSSMRAWGVRHVDIQIVKWGSFEKSAQILSKRTGHAHCRSMYSSLKPKYRKTSTNPDFAFGKFRKQ